MKEFDKAMAEKNALMADAEKCQTKLNMAQRLVGALAANGVIWEQTVENAGQEGNRHSHRPLLEYYIYSRLL